MGGVVRLIEINDYLCSVNMINRNFEGTERGVYQERIYQSAWFHLRDR